MAPAAFRVLQGQARDAADSDVALVAALRRGEPQAELAAWNRFATGVDQTLRRLLGPGAGSGGPAAGGLHPFLPAHRHAARAGRRARVPGRHLRARRARGDHPPPAPALAVADADRRHARAGAHLPRPGRARGGDALLPDDRQAGRQGPIVFRRAHHRRDDAGRGGGGARGVRVDGAAADQPGQQARGGAGAARSDAARISRARGRRSRHESRGRHARPDSTTKSSSTRCRRRRAGPRPRTRGRGRRRRSGTGCRRVARGARVRRGGDCCSRARAWRRRSRCWWSRAACSAPGR